MLVNKPEAAAKGKVATRIAEAAKGKVATRGCPMLVRARLEVEVGRVTVVVARVKVDAVDAVVRVVVVAQAMVEEVRGLVEVAAEVVALARRPSTRRS